MLSNKDEYIITVDGWSYRKIEIAFEKFLNPKYQDDARVSVKAMYEYNLTKDEALHVLAYTGFSAMWINSALKKNVLNSNHNKFVDFLDKALAKLPSTSFYKLFRMVSGNEFEYAVSLEVGKEYIIPQYLSTAKEDYNNTDEVWIITTLNEESKGRDIENISNCRDEKEVLFVRGFKFKVVNYRKINDKRYFYLEEVAH